MNSPANRFVCTKENPWTREKGKWSQHPDAEEIDQEDGYPGGDLAVYVCPHCQQRFKVELPQ